MPQLTKLASSPRKNLPFLRECNGMWFSTSYIYYPFFFEALNSSYSILIDDTPMT